MFKFHILRSSKDIFGHIILIAVPVVLIIFFNYIFNGIIFQNSIGLDRTHYIHVLIVGFAVSFQIFGASLSFENLGNDFFSPIRNRLKATPVQLRNIILSVLFSGTIISFIQTMAIFGAAAIILKITLPRIWLATLLMLLSVIVHQLIGTVVLFLSRSVRTANVVTTFYGIVAPMTIGLYFPLPEHAFVDIMRRYLTPIALANTATFGALRYDNSDVFVGMIPLIILAVGLFALLQPLMNRVTK
ncbi:MAG: hypothetical protein PHU24_05390 [Sphaerochaetaceae bacterium]|nr:hypothetical protein [Sphaerochaetaceae bacterium]MDD2405870.1 hypothetical protein [Sphaerochaetaceae bacterium]MDD4258737.1 hypothetical protein [Sphaerochaetaceae bacterium]MDD4842412.1 hypothetical protein [Sphaerochaetaceae bacterium]